jgi:hypothetical protein
MTSAMNRGTLWFLICLIVTGCSTVHSLKTDAPDEPDLFAQGFDQYLASGDLDALSLFAASSPQGAWQMRAQGIIDMAAQQRQQQTSLEQKNQDLSSCQKDKRGLVDDNKALEEKLKRLKQVLIDMELRVE